LFRFTRRREKLVRAFVDQLPGLYHDGVVTRRALAEAHRQLRQDRPTLDEKREALAHDIAREQSARFSVTTRRSRPACLTAGWRSSRPAASSRPRFAYCQVQWVEPYVAQTNW
jgi:hypothetical protein